MSRVKHLFAVALAALMLCLLMPITAFAEEASDGKMLIYAKLPSDWSAPHLWAWADDGTNAFDAWPGKAMTKGEDGWYTASAPVWVNSIIVNGNSGDVKTEDISIDAAEVWVTVSEDGTSDFTYNDPNAPVAEDITVHVKAPADWSEPHLWAWSAPDGTNAFSSWPGEALQEGEDGWLTLSVPGWVNSIIVNANEGGIQTSDLSVDTGKDLWIVVTDAENAEVTYEAPAAESEPTVAAEPAETKSNTMPIAIVVVVVIAAVAGGVVVSKKKK